MVELRAHPVVHGVALLTTTGQVQLHVVESGRSRIDEVFLMAGNASDGKSLKLPHCRALMARIAIQRGVRANQRETVHVLIDLLNGHIPALDRVALFAVCAHLPLVNVRVTGRALRSHIRENQLGMTLRATHALMHPAQGIFRCVVIEFRYGSNWFPAA